MDKAWVVKSFYHKTLSQYVRKGWTVIFEAFSKKYLEYNSINEKVGGQKDLRSLFSIEEIQEDFADYEIIELVSRKFNIAKESFIMAGVVL